MEIKLSFSSVKQAKGNINVGKIGISNVIDYYKEGSIDALSKLYQNRCKNENEIHAENKKGEK